MATDARKNDFASLVRQRTRDFWTAYQELRAMQDEWNAQSYATTLDAGLAGENATITAAQLGAVVFDTMDAIKVDMDAGHATNVTNIL